MSVSQEVLVIVVPALVIHFLFFHSLDRSYRQRKEQEALLKASSIPQEGVWPPAPTTYTEPQEPEPWAWCIECQRASAMDTVSDSGGRCGYEECSAPLGRLVAWCDLKARILKLPAQPEAEIIYADLVRVNETDTAS